MKAPLWAAACVVGVIVLAGCTDDAAIDEVALEEDIAAALLPSDPAAITAVDCDVEDASPGDTIDCAVAVGDQDLPVTVRLETDGTVSPSADVPLLDADAAATQLAETFTAELGIDTTVECGSQLLVLLPDSEFECIATDDKGVSRVLLVVVGVDSELEIRIK